MRCHAAALEPCIWDDDPDDAKIPRSIKTWGSAICLWRGRRFLSLSFSFSFQAILGWSKIFPGSLIATKASPDIFWSLSERYKTHAKWVFWHNLFSDTIYSATKRKNLRKKVVFWCASRCLRNLDQELIGHDTIWFARWVSVLTNCWR